MEVMLLEMDYPIDRSIEHAESHDGDLGYQ